MLTLLLLVIAFALVFEFINGFHDTANSIATVVATKVLSPGWAVMLAAFMNLIGALTGTAVALTIASGLLNTNVVDVTPQVILCALLGGIIWNLITWWKGLPSSSSHALIGGLCGAGLAAAHNNWDALIWSERLGSWAQNKGLLWKVFVPMITSPIAGFLLGIVVMLLLWAIMLPTLLAWGIDDPKRGPFQTHMAVDAERYPTLTAARVPLTRQEVDIFYKRFSKEAFWPMLHVFWERARFREDDWQVFLKVNRKFAEATAAEASASSVDMGGSRPGRRCASIDLPVPGGPNNSSECAPPAATSSARRACNWPRTSARSGTLAPASGGGPASATGASAVWPLRCAHTASRLAAGSTLARRASAASAALPAGNTSPRPPRPAASAAANTPRTGRRSPVSDSSPQNSSASMRSMATWPDAARMPTAIARSKRPPSLGRSAGARLTVMRRWGNSNCEDWIAARTRSRASRTSVSGRPTRLKAGRPLARWTSTVTSGAASPSSARARTSAIDIGISRLDGAPV